VLLCIRPEALLLKRGVCAAGGFNRLTGRITAVAPGIHQHRIVLDCGGFSLVALCDRKTLPESAYAAGEEFSILFSPFAAHAIE